MSDRKNLTKEQKREEQDCLIGSGRFPNSVLIALEDAISPLFGARSIEDRIAEVVAIAPERHVEFCRIHSAEDKAAHEAKYGPSLSIIPAEPQHKGRGR